MKIFFNSNSNSESKIAIKLYLSFKKSNNENRKSIIMKISGKFIKGKCYSLLFTGDANGDTINDIIEEYDIIKDSHTEENSPLNSNNDNRKENAIKAFFTDIIFHMNPHHGAITDDSFLWSKYSIQYSSYPVLNIISSNPDNKNGKPSYIMIENLINEIIKNNKENYKHSENFCCIPHNISCNFNCEIFKYPFIKKEFLMPIFITGDASSDGYNIVIDSEKMILRDNIKIFKLNKKNVNIPLYIYSRSKINYNKLNFKKDITEGLIKLYSHYLTEKNLKEFKTIFERLPNKYEINRDIIYEDFDDEIKKVKSLIIKLERCNLLNKVNNDNNKENEQNEKIKQCNEMLKCNDDIENFIKFSLEMKQTNENIKEFLYCIFKNDDQKKNHINETINKNKENDNIRSNDYNKIKNKVNQNKKRKIG